MKLIKLLLPVTLLFGAIFFSSHDTSRTYAEETSSEVISSEVISEEEIQSESIVSEEVSSEDIFEEEIPSEEIPEEVVFEEVTYMYASESGTCIVTLISETECYIKLESPSNDEILEGTFCYSKEDNILSIIVEGNDPIVFTINENLTLTPFEEIIEDNISFVDWFTENEDLIQLIMIAIVTIVSSLAQSISSMKKINLGLSNQNNTVTDMANKSVESSKVLDNKIVNLQKFVTENLTDITKIITTLISEDKEHKEIIKTAISEIQKEQEQISKVYTDIDNIKRSMRIAFCNDKQFYSDGRAQAIKKLLDKESGE